MQAISRASFIPCLSLKQNSMISTTNVVLALLCASLAILIHLRNIGTISDGFLSSNTGILSLVIINILIIFFHFRKTEGKIALSSTLEVSEFNPRSMLISNHLQAPEEPSSIQDVITSPFPYINNTLVEDFNIKEAFFKAVIHGDLQAVEIALKEGFHINWMHKGLTALQLAILCKNEDIIQLLTKHCADLNMRSNTGRTALHYAARMNAFDHLIKWIIQGADPNVYDNKGKYYLEWMNKKQINSFISKCQQIPKEQQNEHLIKILQKSPTDWGTDFISPLPREILFQILHYFTPKQIARCEQVSKIWQNCIKTSLYQKFSEGKASCFTNYNIFFKNYLLTQPHLSYFECSECLAHRGILYYQKKGKIYCIGNENQKIKTIASKQSVNSFIIFSEYLIVAYRNGKIIAHHLSEENQTTDLFTDEVASVRFFISQEHLIIFNKGAADLYSADLKKILSFSVEGQLEDIKLADDLFSYRTKKIIHILNIKDPQRIAYFNIEDLSSTERWEDYSIEGKQLVAISHTGQSYSSNLSSFFDYEYLFKNCSIEEMTYTAPKLEKLSICFDRVNSDIFRIYHSFVYILNSDYIKIYDFQGNQIAFYPITDPVRYCIPQIEGNLIIYNGLVNRAKVFDFNPVKLFASKPPPTLLHKKI